MSCVIHVSFGISQPLFGELIISSGKIFLYACLTRDFVCPTFFIFETFPEIKIKLWKILSNSYLVKDAMIKNIILSLSLIKNNEKTHCCESNDKITDSQL